MNSQTCGQLRLGRMEPENAGTASPLSPASPAAAVPRPLPSAVAGS